MFSVSSPWNHLRHAVGFTLVELLVVIAIIAVLATRSIRQKGLQVKSLNTMRQVAGANVAYSTENNGDINVLLDDGDSRQAGGYITKSYWGRLAPFLFTDITVANNSDSSRQIKQRLNAIFSTPDSKLMTGNFQQGVRIYHDVSGLPVPFAFSKRIYKWNTYLKTTNFSDPSQTLYMTYGFYRFDEQDGARYTPLQPINKPRSNKIDYFDNKSGVFSFLDGHVEVLTPPIPERRFKSTPEP